MDGYLLSYQLFEVCLFIQYMFNTFLCIYQAATEEPEAPSSAVQKKPARGRGRGQAAKEEASDDVATQAYQEEEKEVKMERTSLF